MYPRLSHQAAAATAGLVALALLWVQLPVIESARNYLFDLYQVAEPRPPVEDPPVLIVDIDDASITRLGQWPWPRSVMAKLVAKLAKGGASAIGFDVAFAEPDRTSGEALLALFPEGKQRDALKAVLADTPDNDTLFADAIAEAPVVLGIVLTQTGNSTEIPVRAGFATAGDDPRAFVPAFSGAVLPIRPLLEWAQGIGSLNWLPDGDQIVRRVPLFVRTGSQLVPSLAVESLRVAQQASTFVIRASNASGELAFGAKTGVTAVRIGAVDADTDPRGDVRVRFRKTDPRLFIPFWKVLEDDFDLTRFEGRIVLVGTSAAGLLDIRATPLDAAVPGVEVHAQVIENLLTGTRLIRPDWAPGAEFVLAASMGLVLAIVLPFVGPVGGALMGAAVTMLLFFSSWFAFDRAGMLLDPVGPWITCSAVYLTGTLTLYWSEQRQRKWVRDAFGRFVSPLVIERLASDPSRLVLGGEERELTVMFSDLRNFTSISEHMDAQALTSFMNRYFTPMTDLILESSGTIDKYIGDAIVAFWNAPLDDADHARHAGKTVIAMFQALREFNEELIAEAEAAGRKHVEVRCGIGLATGPCSVGNFGSIRHFDYSAMGDTMNLASRLEGATRYYRVPLLAAEKTRDLSPDLAWVEVDRTRVKGRQAVARLFTILGDEKVAASADFAELTERHTALLEAYRDGRFARAGVIAAELATSGPPFLAGLYALYHERCLEYEAFPPPAETWDGVTTLEQK
jgi:adenylate cyclase